MLLYNINDNLKNGYQGEFVGTDSEDENAIFVNFPTAGMITLSRRTWFRYTPDGNFQGTYTQFPIIPCYAITVHKSQFNIELCCYSLFSGICLRSNIRCYVESKIIKQNESN